LFSVFPFVGCSIVFFFFSSRFIFPVGLVPFLLPSFAFSGAFLSLLCRHANVLGLPKGKRWGSRPAMEFQAGSLTIAVMDPTAFGQEFHPHRAPLAFQVDDVAAARDHLKEQGVTFIAEMIDSGSCHQAIFLDPAGNTLDLHHIYGARTAP